MAEYTDHLSAALAGKYRIRQRLGEGGMATVYLADDLKHQREVAVKVLRPDIAATMGAERFLREVRIAATLNHPHILPLFDSGEASGHLYYVMPFIKGESLREKLQREGQLPVSEAARLLREVADALAYAHEHGVVHRDIKPDNVMISRRHALVMDFGVAKAMSEATGGHHATTAGMVIGTPRYMAPEQAAGDPNVDHRADIYALGTMAYEALAGRPPFVGGVPHEILGAHISTMPERLDSHRTGIPGDLVEGVMRCLEKKPASRWQSADELVPVFEAHSASGSSTPVTATAPRAVGRKAGIIAGILGLASVVVLGLWLTTRDDGSGSAAEVRRLIAVMPFESASAAGDGLLFADGMHDDLITQLGKISSLRVIARRSVMGYRNSDKTISEVGRELGVDALLLGRVQQAGGQVRVNVQLVDARSEAQLWGEAYQRELSLDNRFAIQSDISTSVAGALRAALSPAERDRLADIPTENAQAYALYQRAREYFDNSEEQASLENAARLLEQAVQLDPEFALAFSFLAHTRLFQYWVGYVRTPEQLASAKTALDSAFSLDPKLVDAQVALGHYHYWGSLDYDAALGELFAAERKAPSNTLVLVGIGAVRRRQGLAEEALDYFRRAREVDPLARRPMQGVAETLMMLRRYEESLAAWDTTVLLSPDTPYPRAERAYTRLLCCADTSGARQEVDDARRLAITGYDRLGVGVEVARLSRDYRKLLSEVHQVDTVRSDQFLYRSGDYYRGVALAQLGDTAGALAEWRRDRAALQTLVAATPEDERLHGALGMTLAQLGMEQQALESVRRGVSLLPFEREAWRGSYRLMELASVFAQFGRVDSAVHHLKFLLERPGDLSVALIELDPRWDPIRDAPEFRELTAAGR